MKKVCLFLGATALLLSSCMTRIITTAEAPAPNTTVLYQPATRVVYGNSYVQPTQTTTVVRTSPSKTTTTVVQVTPLGEDVSFFLDLKAVGAAFAEANSLEEFEMLLNSSTYMLSSLDLNRDGYVDYLRVVEAIEGYNHVVIIQAVLAQNIFQDVATLTAEMGYSTPYVQIIGAPYIYGANYYVRPVFVRTPPMFAHWRAPRYNPWHSPYYWDYYPHYYHKPAPVYLSHYQAYVTTYITNNRYCNHCEFDDRVHYTNYSRTGTGVSRNDYETRHPEQSFAKRIANADNGGTSRTATISNARELQQRVAPNTTTTTTSGRTSTSRTSQTNAATSSTSRTSSSSGTTSSSSRVNSSTGSSSTSSSSRTSATSSSATSSTSRTSGNSGTSGTSSSTTSTSRTSTTSSTTSSSGRKVSPASTTTTSRVSTNGSARTTTRTVNTDGSSTTTRRGSSSTTSTSSRTSATSSSSGTSRNSSQSRTSTNTQSR